MKRFASIAFILAFVPILLFGQERALSLSSDSLPGKLIQDKLLVETDSIASGGESLRNDSIYTPVSVLDTTASINYWRITERTGERLSGHPDTLLTDYFNRTNADGLGISMAYPGNLGLPMQSRIYSERKDASDFMFFDGYDKYTKAPGKLDFINTKIPYAKVAYQTAGSSNTKEERFQGLFSVNFGKSLNIGLDVDYLYARGYYASQAAKHTDWTFWGSYIADRHEVHAFINPASYTNAENGGITDDLYITHPEYLSDRTIPTYSIPVNFKDTWNYLKGSRYYLNYHYNLGFERNTPHVDEDGDTIKQFIPVSSIIYTFDYQTNSRRFYTNDSSNLNAFYQNRDFLERNDYTRDSTSFWSLKNTIALSLREGFSQWAKFDLTAFLTQEMRNYTLMSKDSIFPDESNNYSTYIGGELAKRSGKILRYNAQGSFGLLGYNAGDVLLSGEIETRIPVLGKYASLKANGYFKNTSPTYYENHYHSKYFWWDEDFSEVKKVYLGGSLDIPHTRTNLSVGVENVTNYIYFDETGFPKQTGENIQVMAVTLQQNFNLNGLHWDNQVVYQTSSNQGIIPLPDLCAYSSLYLQFPVAKVLTIQLGGSLHYFTEYNSPTYDPATQQFRLQHETKVGNYPLISGFANCHLKQTRFFVEFYNLSASFIKAPEYFSMPHYPLNPMIFKMGLCVDFHN